MPGALIVLQLSATVPAPGITEEIVGTASTAIPPDAFPVPVLVKYARTTEAAASATTTDTPDRVTALTGRRLTSARSR